MKSLEKSSQPEALFPEISGSQWEARGPSSSAGMSVSWPLCFWPILITFNNKGDHSFFLPH